MKNFFYIIRTTCLCLFLITSSILSAKKLIITNTADTVPVTTLSTTAPGGVADGLRLWLRADDLSSFVFTGDSMNLVAQWHAQSITDNTVSFTLVDVDDSDFKLDDVNYKGKSYPQYMKYDEKMNFNPSVSFDVNAYMAMTTGPMESDAPADFTSFVSYYSTDYQNDARLYTHGFGGTNPRSSQTRYPAMGFTPKAGAGRVRNDGTGQTDVNGTLRGFYPKSTALEMIHTHAAGTTSASGYVIYNFAGSEQKVTASGNFGNGFRMSKGGTLGGASLKEGSFLGLISEVMFYERALTLEEQREINTYLGIKYAVTLDNNTSDPNNNYDYILSDHSTIVWGGNSAPNIGYHNNIAGLVRDDGSLFINKAKSTTNEGIVGMMTQSHKEQGQGSSPDPELKNDMSGLFWGDNNATEIVTYNNDECYPFTTRTSRVWLVDKTNLDEIPVTIFLGASGSATYDNYMNDGYQAYLLISDNATDFENGTWLKVIPARFEDGYHKFDYTFTDKYTYFSLAFEPKPSTCVSSQFRDDDYFTLTRTNLGTGSLSITSLNNPLTKTNLRSDSLHFTVDAKFQIAADVRRMLVRPVAKMGLVNLRSSGAANTVSSMTYTLSSPSNVTFKIGQIDRYDIIEVYGYCNGNKIFPSKVYQDPLIGGNLKRGYTYNITGLGKAEGTKKGVGRNNPRGILNFEFGFAVEEIVINYSASRKTTTSLDVYPLQLWSPPAFPLPNEAGYAMVKKGTSSVNVCDIVNYTFSILNANANCDSTRVSFEDILPEGMVWLPNSLSFDTQLLDSTVQDNGGQSIIFEGNAMVIDSLMLPGSGRITTIQAQAVFKDNATINTTYYNQSKITYHRKDNQQIESLYSTDANYADSLGTDKRTPTFVPNDTRTYKNISANIQIVSMDCFKANTEISVSVTINNPNASISDMVLDLEYNENFHYITNSFLLDGNEVSGLTENIEELDNEPELGFSTIKGFTLPGNTENTPTVITFKIKAPAIADLDSEIINNIKDYLPLSISFDLSSEADGGICLENAFLNTEGSVEIPFCNLKNYIISNKNVTNRFKR